MKTREQLIESLIRYASDDYADEQLPFIEDCVDGAIDEVCNAMCPWGANSSKLESLQLRAMQRYTWNIQRIAEFHYDKQGKEGVTTYYEAGQTTSFEDGATPERFLENIIPIAKVI